MRTSKKMLLGLLGGAGYSVEANAIFAAMTTPPSAARKTAINTLVVALKAAGVWTLLDTLYVLAAADSQAALLNWKNPGTFTAIAVNSPTFAADSGYTSDGATSRLRTQFTPSVNGVNFIKDSASMWVWSRTNFQNVASDIGSLTAPRASLNPNNASNQIVSSINDAGAVSSSTTYANSIGFFGTTRHSGTTKRFWQNGVKIGADVAANSTAAASQEQWICGTNSTVFSPRTIAAAAWGNDLTGKEATFYSAMLAYMQAVGAA